ncbi:MAG: SDR family oxidoreductase [Firmicutes bacterium]|nr:SDR family oxidoreductase [Bacillota bacterium]
MNFENVVILITGASKGIGQCLANILCKYNAKVIGVYNHTKIENAKYDTYKCNLSSEKEIVKLVNYVNEQYGRIDVVVNCAALSIDKDIEEKSGKEFLDVLTVNLVAPFLLSKYAAQYMNRGVIINLSSLDAQETFDPISMDYAASKAGLENLTKNLALRFPKIKICALAPAWVDTQTVLEMDPNYLKEQMTKHNQEKLLKKENVALKIIEMIINNDDYVSGDIVRMDGKYE